MKKYLSIVTALALTSGLAFGQQGPGPGEQNPDPPKDQPTEQPEGAKTQNAYNWSYASQSAAGGGGQVQNRNGKTELPADVQEIVKNFQQERARLMNQLKTCTEEQRKECLQQMEQLRTQLREQVCQLREQAREQALQMRTRFGNNRDRILDQGAGSGGGGRDR